MEGLYQDKYNIESTRLQGWNYGSDAYYFVTICTKNRKEFFGEILIDNGGGASMALSPIGKIVRDCWLAIMDHFSFVILDTFIIMPNHIHGIIQICKNQFKNVETQHAASLQDKKSSQTFYRLSRQSLSVVVRSFKSAVTNECHKRNLDFRWQPRFYDHIIRNEQPLNKIRHYIRANPYLWHRDRNNPENIWY